MSTIYQYMKSTAPDVVAVVERNNESRRAWKERLFEWASELTGKPREELTLRLVGWENDSLRFTGFYKSQVAGVELPSQWTKEPVRPYKTNPFMAEYRKVASWKAETVPGRPGTLYGNGYFGGGATFVVDGVACSGIGFTPESNEPDDSADRWQEIKASEYYAAAEAYREEA